MDNLSAFDSSSWDPKLLPQHPAYISGNALAWLYRGNKQASVSYPLSGRLYLTKANWLMLSVPNALVRGVFDAISAPGAELPTQSATGAPETASGLGDVLNANIAVMTADEVAKIGADSINERGHSFGYALSGMTELTVSHLPGVSKAWALQISAPSLSALRKSYGLSPTPRDQGKFHILVAVRRKGVLSDNGQAKGYETPGEAAEGESFSNPISRGELKAAGVYNFKGDVQGVSLRKTLHEILDDLKHPGLAYNNAHTGEALAIIPGNKQHQEAVLGALRKRLAERAAQNVVGAAGHKISKRPLEEGVDYSITPLPKQRERMHPVTLSPAAVQNFVTAQGFDRLGAEPVKYQQQWLGERYRLTPDAAGNLVGAVPGLAKKQLLSGEPIYGYQTVPGWRDTKAAADITKLSPKWSDREHLLAALPKHLTDTQAAMSTPGGNVDKEMTDLALIARAWLKSQQQKELLAARLKKFQETAAYPSLALQTPAAAILPSSKVLPQALSKGLTDEQGHASNDQVAKAAAADHLQKDARDYEEEKLTDKLARTQILKELLAAKEHSDNKRYAAKHDILARLMAKAPQDWEIDDPKPKYKGITHTPTQFRFHTPASAIPGSLKINGNVKTSGSVYAAQARDYLNFRQPIVYDNTQPLSANIANQLRTIKRRGDFALQSQRHLQASRAAADPLYRQQLALQAFHGTLPQPSAVDRAIESIDVDALMPNVNSWAGK